MDDTEQYLKLPVTLTKITSKTGQDHELMWQISVETHSKNADQVQVLIPFVNSHFVMVLVKVESQEELKEAQKDDGITLGEPEPQKKKTRKPAKKTGKSKKRSR